ncbi:MAG: arylsulfatase [Luteolibacter sp.]
MRPFLKTLLLSLASIPAFAEPAAKPNIVFFLTDDQGLSDLAFYGNPSLETPNLDKLAKTSVRLDDFEAAPTCSPTRASLLTGQHEFRVGITHTISGRSLIKPGVPTLSARLKSAGYATGIFGKWHLGDTYPSRPQDIGFDEVFIHLGGGIGQTPDYWGNKYFDPHILHNGTWQETDGYCTHIFTDEAWSWIEKQDDTPWFAFVPYNAPHVPLEVEESLAQKYLDKGLPESQARFYAMIDDIDTTVGKFLDKLEESGLAENTIVIFMGDNGSAKGGKADEMEFNADLRGTKAMPYQGGVRVPAFIRWPAGGLTGGRSVQQLTSVMDIYPTLAEYAGVPLAADAAIDGKSLSPILADENNADWPERNVVTHVGRWANHSPMDKIKHPGSAIRNERFSLVNGTELYDLKNDRGQEKDVAADFPEVFQTLSKQYDDWWKTIIPEIKEIPAITVGAVEAPLSQLTCMDWAASVIEDQGAKYPPWDQRHLRAFLKGKPSKAMAWLGAWKLDFKRSGKYKITLRTLGAEAPQEEAALKTGEATLMLGDKTFTEAIKEGDRAVSFEVEINSGITTMETEIKRSESEVIRHGAFFADVEFLSPTD